MSYFAREKQSIKRIIAIIVSIAMIATLISGCGKKSPEWNFDSQKSNFSIVDVMEKEEVKGKSHTLTVTSEKELFADNIDENQLIVYGEYTPTKEEAAVAEKAEADKENAEGENVAEGADDGTKKNAGKIEESFVNLYDISGFTDMDDPASMVDHPDEFSADDVTGKIGSDINVDEKTIKKALETNEKGAEATDLSEPIDEKLSFKLEYVNAKELTITFDDEKKRDKYIVYVHNEATKDGHYAMGETAEPVVSATPRTTELSRKSKDPIIELKMKNAVLSDTISAKQISLTGAFKPLKISRVARTGDTTLSVYTKGSLSKDKTKTGGIVTLTSGTAVDYDFDIQAHVSIIDQVLLTDFTTSKYKDGLLTFHVEVAKDTFDKEPTFALTGKKGAAIDSVKFKNDLAAVSIKVAAKDVDDALSKVDGGTLTAKSGKGEPASIILDSAQASLNAYMDYVEKDDKAYKGTMVVFAHNGTITKFEDSDVKIGGDFKKAEVLSTKKVDEGIEVVFHFESEKNAADEVMDGTLTLNSDKILINDWGTTSRDTACALHHAAIEDREDAILDLWNEYGDTIKNVGSGVSTTVEVGKKILELTGVLESDRKVMDKTYSTLVSVQGDVTQTLSLVTKIQAKIDALTNSSYKTLYDAQSTKWDAFYNGEFSNLKGQITAYKKYIDNAVLELVGEPEVTLYLDKAGAVTVPKRDDKSKSYRGTKITSAEKYTLSEEDLSEVMKKSNDGTKIYSGILTDIKAAFIKAHGDALGGKIYECFEMQTNYNAVTSSKVSGADSSFTKVCSQILGKSGTEPALDYYDTMLSYVYNFYSEAYPQREQMRNALKSVVAMGHALAVLETKYVFPSAEVDDFDGELKKIQNYLRVNTASTVTKISVDQPDPVKPEDDPWNTKNWSTFMKVFWFPQYLAKKEIEKAPKVTEEEMMKWKNNKEYSYVAKKWLTLDYIDMTASRWKDPKDSYINYTCVSITGSPGIAVKTAGQPENFLKNTYNNPTKYRTKHNSKISDYTFSQMTPATSPEDLRIMYYRAKANDKTLQEVMKDSKFGDLAGSSSIILSSKIGEGSDTRSDIYVKCYAVAKDGEGGEYSNYHPNWDINTMHLASTLTYKNKGKYYNNDVAFAASYLDSKTGDSTQDSAIKDKTIFSTGWAGCGANTVYRDYYFMYGAGTNAGKDTSFRYLVFSDAAQ